MVRKTSSPAADAAAAPDGLTDEQHARVLQEIASAADILSELLGIAAAYEGDEMVPVLVHAARRLAYSIGLMADGAQGFDALGSAERWLYGPHFGAHGRGV